ncbi:hypothetical protein, partial [Selenomonas sp. oral taxon 138]|uniref:hypothetical protein n=1 Tax=Selenomonas sp. oral taxon 138 TaxID=712532 RepID=UPI001E3928AB
FALFLLPKCVLRTENRVADRLYSLCGAGCAVLENHNGRMRLARPYGSFSTFRFDHDYSIDFCIFQWGLLHKVVLTRAAFPVSHS